MRISDWSSDVCSSDLAAADAGVAAREGVDLQQQDQAHDALVERLADAAAMRQHEARLQLGDLAGRDGLPREAAEAGVDAVDPAAFRDHVGHGADRKSTRLNSSH